MRKMFAVVGIMICLVVSCFSACSIMPKTLEGYVKSSDEIAKTLQGYTEETGMTLDVSDNDIILTYDVQNIENVNEDVAKSEAMISHLNSSFDEYTATFTGLCKSIESDTKLEGIRVIVKFVYGDEILAEHTYTSES